MRVRINDNVQLTTTLVFDGEQVPIVIELTPEEKELIANMGDQTMFCVYPENCDPKDILRFMKEGEVECSTNVTSVKD